eukprot:5523275-Amphidinium_carterae.1
MDNTKGAIGTSQSHPDPRLLTKRNPLLGASESLWPLLFDASPGKRTDGCTIHTDTQNMIYTVATKMIT